MKKYYTLKPAYTDNTTVSLFDEHGNLETYEIISNYVLQGYRQAIEGFGYEFRKEELKPTDAQKLAELLHDHLCTSNHMDGCSWGWNHGKPDCWTTDSAHKKYLAMAENILAKVSYEQAAAVIEYL